MFGYEKPNSAYKKITIKEVARASGVSIKTISRVLNQRPDVAPETRGHVLRIINKMGFSPNALARGMVRQRSLTIGILSSSLNMNGTALALDGIFAEADSLGYTLLLKELSDLDIDQTDRLLRSLLDYRVDGIIWAFPRAERDIQGFMGMELPVPIVFLSQNQLPTYTTVTLDYYKSGYLATLHLIEQGYQEIGYISGPPDWWDTRECKRGWETALRDAQRKVPKKAAIESGLLSTKGHSAAAQLFSQYPNIDAVFVANSRMVMGVLLEASRRGKEVPREIGIVGLDDASDAAFFGSPLTLIAQDYPMLGRTAMQKLAVLIETNNKAQNSLPTHTVIEPILLARESSSRLNSSRS